MNQTILNFLKKYDYSFLIGMLAIFIFGGESIRGFMFALIVGVIVGTYSSVFIATPVMFDTQKGKAITEEAIK